MRIGHSHKSHDSTYNSRCQQLFTANVFFNYKFILFLFFKAFIWLMLPVWFNWPYPLSSICWTFVDLLLILPYNHFLFNTRDLIYFIYPYLFLLPIIYDCWTQFNVQVYRTSSTFILLSSFHYSSYCFLRVFSISEIFYQHTEWFFFWYSPRGWRHPSGNENHQLENLEY